MMDSNHNAPRSSLTGMLGRSALNAEEIAELRRKAWQDCSMLIVHISDPCLTGLDRECLGRIAKRLYEGESPCT